MNQATLLFSPMHYSGNKKCKCIWCDSCEILWRKIRNFFFLICQNQWLIAHVSRESAFFFICILVVPLNLNIGHEIKMFPCLQTLKKKDTVWTTALKAINIVWTLKLCGFFKVACLSVMPKFFTVENLAMYFVPSEIPYLHRENWIILKCARNAFLSVVLAHDIGSKYNTTVLLILCPGEVNINFIS